ncbi:hypothetical protein IF2G_09338 [Cordyceps javanica]|nr:hypothetical protein IF2G_09338 [Cordyceps javanica]
MKWRSDRRFREIDWSPPVCERGIYSEPRNLIRQPLKRMDDQILGRSCSEVMELPLCVSCCELGTSLLITTIASIMSTKTTSNLASQTGLSRKTGMSECQCTNPSSSKSWRFVPTFYLRGTPPTGNTGKDSHLALDRWHVIFIPVRSMVHSCTAVPTGYEMVELKSVRTGIAVACLGRYPGPQRGGFLSRFKGKCLAINPRIANHTPFTQPYFATRGGSFRSAKTRFPSGSGVLLGAMAEV